MSKPTRLAPENVVVSRTRWVFRHPLAIRVTHWINALAIFVLLSSGLQIFNAHPALYWGIASDFDNPVLSITAEGDGDTPDRGVTRLFGHSFDTTGMLGLSSASSGDESERAFPSWATLPAEQDLATGRRWHFTFAWLLVLNGAAYLIYGLVSRQLASRVIPDQDQWSRFGSTLKEHLTLSFPKGVEAKRYNLFQKLSYLGVLLILVPGQILSGLAMSPGMDAVAPFLLTALGGRQSARTLHFTFMTLFLLFIVIHVAMVVVSGIRNNLRGMITGWYAIGSETLESRDE